VLCAFRSEALNGLPSIRAFKREPFYSGKILNMLDT
jgi:hypothetical protein